MTLTLFIVPMKWVLLLSHFTGEVTRAPTGRNLPEVIPLALKRRGSKVVLRRMRRMCFSGVNREGLSEEETVQDLEVLSISGRDHSSARALRQKAREERKENEYG